MSVRRATLADLPPIVLMGADFHAASPMQALIEFDANSMWKFCEGAIDSPDIGLWVAEHDGQVIGMTAAVHFPAYFNATAFIVQELFWWVKPEARSTGAGKALLAEIEQWAKAKGARAVFMVALADKNEEKMQNLYARMGYRPLERTFVREVT